MTKLAIDCTDEDSGCGAGGTMFIYGNGSGYGDSSGDGCGNGGGYGKYWHNGDGQGGEEFYSLPRGSFVHTLGFVHLDKPSER